MGDWHISDLFSALSVERFSRENEDQEITGFSIDTRTLAPGEAFFAIKGENFDGHDFLPQAVAKGARVIVAARLPEALNLGSIPAMIVPDPLEALQNLARFHRRRHPGLFIGVTGSNGKTTTKEILAHLFGANRKTWATTGNLNNHIGLPLSLLRVPLDTQVAIMEMGMNHPGEIRFLAEIARPQAVVVTMIGPAHIGILGSLDAIASAKAEILEGLTPEDHAVLPGDDPFFPFLRSRTKAQIHSFGEGRSNDLSGTILGVRPNGVDVEVQVRTHIMMMPLAILGRHNALNALAGLTLFHAVGGDLAAGVERLKSFRPVNARMEAHEIDGMRVILDCYNANPASMKEAVEYLRGCPGRRVAVLGDMRELGDQEELWHRRLGEAVARSGIDVLVAVGDAAQSIAEEALQGGMNPAAVHSCRNTDEAARLLSQVVLSGDTVLLKASRGMHFEAIVTKLWPSLPCELH
jgi:UDP-N-acetylmuramoyl-tripeptide--D-alanyl-D-alanine ligase